MKKIIFSMVGSVLISLCAVQAQQNDTTGTASQSRERQQQRQQYSQQRDHARKQRDQRREQERQAWRQRDMRNQGNDEANQGMVIVPKEDIPKSLKKTLQKDKYAGWEDATIYRNTNTGEYVIAPRAYRFDSNGNEIEVDNPGYGDSDSYRNGNKRGERKDDKPSDSYRQDNTSSEGDQSSIEQSEQQSDDNGEPADAEAREYTDSRSSEMSSDQYPATEQDNERKAGNEEPSNSYRNDGSASDVKGQQQSNDQQPSPTESQRDK